MEKKLFDFIVGKLTENPTELVDIVGLYNDEHSTSLDEVDTAHAFLAKASKVDYINTEFAPITEKFDDFTIDACRYVDVGKNKVEVEVCDDHEADFWSVYTHFVRGGVNCVADFATKEQAEAFVRFMESARAMQVSND